MQHMFLTDTYMFQFYKQTIMRLYKKIRFSVQIAHSKLKVSDLSFLQLVFIRQCQTIQHLQQVRCLPLWMRSIIAIKKVKTRITKTAGRRGYFKLEL